MNMRDFTLKRKWERFTLILVFIVAVCSGAYAQNRTVTGKVVDAVTNETIVGAAVTVQGTAVGTATDVNGNFKLSVPANATLVIKSVGYEQLSVQASATAMTIKLSSANNNLNEVVVVGYGTQTKATLTGAVSTVSSKVFEDRGPVNNPLESLQGEVPGVIVTRTSAQPGRENWNFQIRGATSTNGQDPLIILDGVALSSNAELNTINPNDIDNISFLKDASAAIYGARAAFGVVLISTKKAKAGKMIVQYDVAVSQKLIGLQPHLVNDQQWGSGLAQALTNDNYGVAPTSNVWYIEALLAQNPPASGYIDITTLPGYAGSANGVLYNGTPLPPFGDVKDFTFFNTNMEKILWGNATSQQHNLSFSGRSDKAGYRVSLGYENDGSPLQYGTNGSQRYNLRLNHDYTFSDKVKLETNISLEKNDIQQPSLLTSSSYSALSQYAQPGMPAFNALGQPYGWGTVYSPPGMLRDGGANLEYDDRIILNTTLSYNFARHLTFTATAGYNDYFQDIRTDTKQVQYYNYVGTILDTTFPTNGVTSNGANYYRQNTTEPYYNLIARVAYNNTFNSVHNVGFMLGSSYERDEYNSFNARTYDLGNENIPSLGLGVNNGTAGFVTDGETQNHYALGSYFGRATYSYAGKYLLEAIGRYDGSSKFIAENRWKAFGGVTAGWVISDESFMKNQKVIKFLKLRASYGTTGNQGGIGLYDYVQSLNVNTGGPLLGASPVSTVTTAGSLVALNRTWETVKNKNLGLDFALINNHLTGSFDIFQKENTNMLLGQTYPAELGATAPAQNIGDLKTWGWETLITWKDKVGGLSYSVSATMTDNQNKLIHYGGKNVLGAGTNSTVEGYPLNAIFGLQYAGRLQTQAQVDAYNAKYAPTGSTNNIGLPIPTALANPAGQVSGIRPGDNSYKDVNGDGKLSIGTSTTNPGDLVYLGTNDPRYSFGLNIGLQWKGFDFYSIIQGVAKRTILRSGNWRIPFNTVNQGQTNEWIGNTWSPSNPNAYYPNLHTVQFSNTINAYNYQPSSWVVQNGAYARLKNVVIGYTLPQNLMNRIKAVSKIRVYVSGSDLTEVDGIHDGWDPEATNGVSNNERFPFYRLITVGANVTF
jgi:TonB-linked SusC/RagA family outer membrane protein